MSSAEPQEVECRWCGAKAPEGAEVCPVCRRPVVRGELRPLDAGETGGQVAAPPRPIGPPIPRRETPRDEEPLAPAPGQEEFGSWANIRQIFRTDKMFGALLVLRALGIVIDIVTGAWTGAIIGGIVLWGVVTFRWWGYLIAMLGAGSGVFYGVLFMFSGGLGVTSLIGLAVNAFVLWVLYSRKDFFD